MRRRKGISEAHICGHTWRILHIRRVALVSDGGVIIRLIVRSWDMRWCRRRMCKAWRQLGPPPPDACCCNRSYIGYAACAGGVTGTLHGVAGGGSANPALLGGSICGIGKGLGKPLGYTLPVGASAVATCAGVGAGLVCSGAEEVLPYVNVVESAGASSWTSLLSGSAGNMSPIGL